LEKKAKIAEASAASFHESKLKKEEVSLLPVLSHIIHVIFSQERCERDLITVRKKTA